MADLPDALTDRVAFLLQLALGRAQAMGEAVLVPFGITGREYGVLAVLAHLAPCTQTLAGSTLGIDRTTAVAVLAGLQERGLVRRVPDPANRRAYLVSLTDEGERVRAGAAAELVACDDRFLAGLTDADREHLRTILRRLADPEVRR